MDFYKNVLSNISNESLIDLSTGEPFIFTKIADTIKSILKPLIYEDPFYEKLGKYENYDGLPLLKEKLLNTFSKIYNRNLTCKNIIITPGVQSTLRYIHNICETQNKKIFIPFHLDFPGVYPHKDGLLHEDVLPLPIETNADDIDQIVLENIDKIRWKNIGFTIISNPHNPTGIYFSEMLVNILNKKASENNSFLVIDHTYDLPFASITTEAFDHSKYNLPNIINLYSFSKVGLASERIAFCIAPENIISDLKYQLINNIIQTPKVGQYIATELFTKFEQDDSFQNEIRECYNQHWEIAFNKLMKLLKATQFVNVAKRGGAPFLYLEIENAINAAELKALCRNMGLLITISSDITVQSPNNQTTRNGIRLGLGKSNAEIVKGVQIFSNCLNQLFEKSEKIKNL